LIVALALQIGVNYANDYSDGIRGTDDDRLGPLRLVGQGIAAPRAVRNAAFASFLIAALAGLLLVALSGFWWLLIVGAASIGAAWFYTGGSRPYGYAGWGEVFVFVFFGPVPVLGTLYVQTGTVTAAAIAASVGIGALTSAILVTNNLRDIPTDRSSGKLTLAVRLGDSKTRALYVALIVIAFVAVVMVALVNSGDGLWPLLGLTALPWAVPPLRVVTSGAVGPGLIAALVATGRLVIAYCVALCTGLILPLVI
jgi:1,4-dihydroxy-2-naphthoate octaprenyltransferase